MPSTAWACGWSAPSQNSTVKLFFGKLVEYWPRSLMVPRVARAGAPVSRVRPSAGLRSISVNRDTSGVLSDGGVAGASMISTGSAEVKVDGVTPYWTVVPSFVYVAWASGPGTLLA